MKIPTIVIKIRMLVRKWV